MPLSLRGSEATEAISCIDNFEIATSAYGGLAMTRACHKIWSHTSSPFSVFCIAFESAVAIIRVACATLCDVHHVGCRRISSKLR